MPKPEEYIVGIDIGSSKVGVLIGQRGEKGAIEVVGKGLAPNRGTRRGNIVNVEATVEALRAASEEAEVMAGVEIGRAYIGVGGADIRAVNARGMVAVAKREIAPSDIDRVLQAAKSASAAFGSRDPARRAAGVHRRRAGRHLRSARHAR
jgi:cell division protein FtsA